MDVAAAGPQNSRVLGLFVADAGRRSECGRKPDRMVFDNGYIHQFD